MRKFVKLLVVLMLAVVFCMPTSHANACPPPGGWCFEIIFTYYSDYFSTYVGSSAQYCGGDEVYLDGTLDGAYKTKDWTNCTTQEYHQACYQKVNGSWVVMSCP